MRGQGSGVRGQRRRPWGVALLAALIVGLVACAVAAESGKQESDIQDLVFLGGRRPVLLRLHVQVDGRPYQAVWNEYVHALFQYLDRDGDGILTKDEGGRASSAVKVLERFRQPIFFPQGDWTAHFSDLDADPADGIVTEEELAGYYRRYGAGPLLIANESQGATADLTKTLYQRLDGNNDGKLSPDELTAAASALLRFDLDDDEMLGPRELTPALPPGGGQFVGRSIEPEGSVNSGFFVVGFADSAAALAQELLRKYDKDTNRRLSRAELGLGPADFGRLDTNRDGQLDAAELGKFLGRPPDVELTVRVGKAGPGQGYVEQRPAPLAAAVRRSAGAALLITLGPAEIDVRRVEDGPADFRVQQGRQFYQNQFKLADADKNGFLDAKEVLGDQRNFLRQLFPLADRDGDGRLTEPELFAYLDLQDRAAASCTVLTIADHGRGLFEFLDADRDGRLGQRELRTAWARLRPWDRNGDGLIDKAEVPLQCGLSLGRGQLGMVRGGTAAAVPLPARGPLWFRKMDRNGDGDVSPREFLGARADFQKVDADGDGLIDVGEAERASRNKRASPPRPE
jgi:Ca2+-binding EF-hand superfamily protein